jgi:hypothetical protein
MLNNVLEGEELIKHRKRTLNDLTELLSWEMYHLSKDSTLSAEDAEDKVAVLENIIKIYSYVFSDGSYGYYHIKVPFFHGEAADIYLDSGKNAKALEHLKSAADHCIAFDNLPPVSRGLVTNKKGNQCYNLLKSFSSEKINPIRDTPEFKEICENLRKYAKEDD